jgi:hypothetical protein
MNQKTTLSIKTPCSEKFDNFLSTQNGGFCSSCKKEVIDFRNWSDIEIANHFKNVTKTSCGYFREEQLKTYTDDNFPLKRNNSFRSVGLASVSLFSLLSFNNVFGQTKEKPLTFQTENNKVKQVEEQPEGIIIKGVISDELGPLAGANVALKNSSISVTTNFDGEFTFPKPIEKGAVILVSYLGFKTQVINVTSETNIITLKMDESVCLSVGEVSVARVYQSKPSFVQRLKSWLKNE